MLAGIVLRLFAIGRQRRIGKRPDERGGATDRLVGVGAAGAEHDQAGVIDRVVSPGFRVLPHFQGHT